MPTPGGLLLDGQPAACRLRALWLLLLPFLLANVAFFMVPCTPPTAGGGARRWWRSEYASPDLTTPWLPLGLMKNVVGLVGQPGHHEGRCDHPGAMHGSIGRFVPLRRTSRDHSPDQGGEDE
jgi:hypothetical protein